MPAVSQKQRGLIFSKRTQYGSKSKTPDIWKWVWEDSWENVGKLPKYKKSKKNSNKSSIMKYEQFINEWFKFGDKKEEPEQEDDKLVCKECGYIGYVSKFKPFLSHINQCPKCKSKNIVSETEYNKVDDISEEGWGWYVPES